MRKLIFRKEKPERVRQLIKAEEAFPRKQFDPEARGIPEMPPYSEAPFDFPPNRHGHPRVELTADMLPDISDAAWRMPP